jgi:hypothetical protein
MRLTLLILLAFNSDLLTAQKFALIENKGDNAHYFDYSNPNSFVGVLMNNIDYIPTLVDQNGYEGVYDDFMLMQLGVPSEQMLSLTTSERISLYDAQTNEEIICIKTTQSLDAFLDSVKDIPIYQDLLLFEKERLQLYWNNSCENCALRIFSKFYFDIRNTDALLIEDKENERWIHLIGKLNDGRRMITLSLQAEQLRDNDCFRFLHFVPTDEGTALHNELKKQALYQSQSEICRAWLQGKSESYYYSTVLTTFDQINEPYCWSYTTSSGVQLVGVTNSESIGHLQQTNRQDSLTTELQLEQQRGDLFYIYSYETEDTVYIVKTNSDFATAYQSYAQYPDFTNYLYSDSTWLNSWWQTAQIGDTLRGMPQVVTYWKEGPQLQAAFYYKIGTDLYNVPKAYVTDLLFYTIQDTHNEIFLSYNYQMARDYEEFSGAMLKAINRDIEGLEKYLNPEITWNSIIEQPTKKMSFNRIQKNLQLIYPTLQY